MRYIWFKIYNKCTSILYVCRLCISPIELPFHYRLVVCVLYIFAGQIINIVIFKTRMHGDKVSKQRFCLIRLVSGILNNFRESTCVCVRTSTNGFLGHWTYFSYFAYRHSIRNHLKGRIGIFLSRRCFRACVDQAQHNKRKSKQIAWMPHFECSPLFCVSIEPLG